MAAKRARRGRLASPDTVLGRLRRAPDALRRRLILAAWLHAGLAAGGGRVAVIGGSALEFYTQGEYATADLDLVTVDRALLGEQLEALGFVRSGRYWVATELNLLVEVPDDTLKVGGSPGDWERVTAVEVRGIGVASIIGLEDLVVDRLLAARYWNDEASLRWARVLLRYWGAGPPQALRIDRVYLDSLAQREGVGPLLAALWAEETPGPQ